MAKLHWLDSLKTDPHPLLIFANTVICTSCICYCITKIKPFQFRKTDHFLLFVDTPIFCLLICTCLTFHLLPSFTLLDTHSSSILSTPANLEDGNTAYTLPANSTVKLPDFCKISSIFNNNHCLVYVQPLWLQYSFPQFLPPFQTTQQPTNTKLSA